MLFDAIRQIEVSAIPKRLEREWKLYTSGITPEEHQGIIIWINDKFDEVVKRLNRVQPSGWLGSGFDWIDSSLLPIYRECRNHLSKGTDQEIEEKAGQIFG